MGNRVVAMLTAWSLLLATGCSKRDSVAPSSPARSYLVKAPSAVPALPDATAVSAGVARGAARLAAPSQTPVIGEARRAAAPAGTREIRGKVGLSSDYVLFVPESWNGDLVLYTHGYIPETAPVGVASVEALGEHVAELRDLLLARGFAVGYSSYSENGFNVKEGALATKQLRELFSSKVGTPSRTFLIGQSLGALDAVMLAEGDPDGYSGVLTAAGALGGSRSAIDYFGHVRVLFDLFYPGVLPGSLLELPPNLDIQNGVIVPAVTAMAAHPEGAFAISQIAQAPVPFRSGEELVTSIATALAFHAVALEDLKERTHGHSFFDNEKTIYVSATLAPDVIDYINGTVDRFSATPDAKAYLDHYYEATGRLSIPTITLHMRWDPVVPIFQESLYADRVAANGRLDLLEQRTIEKYGHPSVPPVGEEITASELAEAFDDLVARAAPAARVTAER